MGEFEAAGEIVTVGMLGRALEPHAGEGHGEGAMCLNCGTALIGPHCHRCGQSAHVHRSLGAIGHEIAHGVAHFEGKFWRTLPLLVWRPGDLTRRYIRGERARFVSPMAIFLFSIFAMFAVFSWAGISAPSNLSTGEPEKMVAEARTQLVKQRAEAVVERDEHPVGDRRRQRIERNIAEIDETLANLPEGKGDRTNINVRSALSGWALVDHGIEKWKKNPSLMLYKLQASVYKFSWLLIPLSLPFVWLLFAWKRDYKLYDHTVFITYSIAFMSLLFIVITIAAAIGLGAPLLTFAAFAVPFVHITRQLKQAYRLRWWSAILRALILSWFITIILMLFLLILLALGMSG
ncbi:DUF3667 domain-containing protein [Sphingomonas sp. M1-B02]|uniref:DUF3667 domain-containing protein n=1 Tax=Sphingomonas sp. M1-B02 TaxID=3114300 RepID=UPI00223F9A33|nr:DUF3667 domain-containing protein [Sphingomonas sp. S6-11]UZK65113.1 DUF3667 domain-containing protein [Sphingomonas sp. S6-11]